jgi:hypothetical protein
MSRHSRGYTAAALLAALMAIPAMAQAQTSVAEKSLMNRVGREARDQAGQHQPVARGGTGDRSQASRALLGTVGAVGFAAREAEGAYSGSPGSEQALLGRPARSTTRE